MDDVEPVEQVLAELARLDQLGQVAVGGGDDAHVHLDRVGRADPLDLALLQHAQQLHLGGERDVADLVEEDGAAVGGVEEALLVALRAGEGALHVAEELRLEERLGEGAAVQGHEGMALARAAGVEGAGHQLLAGAALAGDEHRGGAVGHRVDHPRHLAHGRGVAHQPLARDALALAQGALQLPVAIEERLALGRLGHRARHQLDVVEGLGQVVVGAGPDRRQGRLDGGVPGHHDDLDLGPAVLHRVEQLQAGELRHLDVEEGDVEVLLGQLLGGDDGRVEPGDVVALLAQQGLERAQQGRLVVDHQHADGLGLGRVSHVASPSSCVRFGPAGVPRAAPARSRLRARRRSRRGSMPPCSSAIW